jgi:signal transduction histidine kinase
MKGEIEFSAERQNGHVNIIIRDDGPGIPIDQVKKIFQPFYTTKEEGTGLGLYITRQLVERNSGQISVESTPGKGTVFLLKFKA